MDPPLLSRCQPDEAAGRKRRHILIVEDNRADVFLIRESVGSAQIEADLHVVHDGEEAIRFFDRADQDPSAPCPDLVLLDINLPKRSGREVVRRMRQHARCADALVVVVTSSDSERDHREISALGVNAYFRKPSEYESFMKLGQVVRELLAE